MITLIYFILKDWAKKVRPYQKFIFVLLRDMFLPSFHERGIRKKILSLHEVSECLRFVSSWGIRIFFLSHDRDKTIKHIFLDFFSEFKTYHLSYSIYKIYRNCFPDHGSKNMTKWLFVVMGCVCAMCFGAVLHTMKEVKQAK